MLNSKTAIVALMAIGGVAYADSNAWCQAPAHVGTFTLVEVNQQPLPVVTETTDDCREEVLSGTLTLSAENDWTIEYNEKETCGTEQVEEEVENEDGEYTVEGQTIRFSDDTDEFNANEIEIENLGVGTASADGLSVTLQDGRTVLTFRRRAGE